MTDLAKLRELLEKPEKSLSDFYDAYDALPDLLDEVEKLRTKLSDAEHMRGTFADGIEAAANILHDPWASAVRALAQDQRESTEGRIAGSRSLGSNPAPTSGQSKTGLTGSHPGAPTQEADELLRAVLPYLYDTAPAELYNRIDAHLSRKEK